MGGNHQVFTSKMLINMANIPEFIDGLNKDCRIELTFKVIVNSEDISILLDNLNCFDISIY